MQSNVPYVISRDADLDPEPGSGMEKKSMHGSPDHFSESLETVFRVKNT
jgi:hypothetical protein